MKYGGGRNLWDMFLKYGGCRGGGGPVSDYNPHHAHKIKKTSAVPEGGTELGVTEFVRIAWIIVPTGTRIGLYAKNHQFRVI